MDIDLDVKNRDEILSILPHIPASIIKNDKIDKHNSGVYFQNIPHDPDTGYSSIDYDNAEKIGYMKFDFLNNTIYGKVKNPAHLDKLANTDPDWRLFEHVEIVKQLHQISRHAPLVIKFKPKNIDELAALIALIRPAKAHLQNSSKATIMENIWKKDKEKEQYQFKKSHSYAYALSIIVQLNLLVEELSNEI